MRKLGIDEWLVRLVQSMYKDVRSRVRVGDGYSEEFGVGVGVHQGSVLSPLLFIIVLEALSREFRTGCPWELLYADDLMISAESMEELLVKVQTWKTEIEKRGLRVTMGKTKIMESGINLDVLKKSGKYLCGVCQSGVGSSNAIFCGGCKRWVHKKCSGIKGPLRPDPEFRCARCLGTARAIDKEKFQRLRLETKSLKLSQSSATLGTCSLQEVAARWLRSHAANVHGASSANCFPFSPTTICPFWPEVRCTHHVWGVWCCMQQRLGPWRWIHWTVSGVMTVPWSVGSAMSGQRTKLAPDSLLIKLGIQDLDVVLRTSRMRWFGHVEHSTCWIAEVRKLNVVAQKRSGRPRKSWDEVLENDRKKLGMDSADPQNCSEWIGRLRERLVKKPNPRWRKTGL